MSRLDTCCWSVMVDCCRSECASQLDFHCCCISLIIFSTRSMSLSFAFRRFCAVSTSHRKTRISSRILPKHAAPIWPSASEMTHGDVDVLFFECLGFRLHFIPVLLKCFVDEVTCSSQCIEFPLHGFEHFSSRFLPTVRTDETRFLIASRLRRGCRFLVAERCHLPSTDDEDSIPMMY